MEPSGSLAGEVAIVTGGSHGIGRAIIELFAAEGAAVAFCGRDEDAGWQAEREVAADGGRVAFSRCDVADEQDVIAFVEACRTRFGAPTILVNNAGINANFDATEMSEEQWDRFFGIDLKAAWLAAKHVLPDMKRAGRGAIVNVSSLHGFVTLEGFFPYAAAKSGLLGLTRSLGAGLRVARRPGQLRGSRVHPYPPGAGEHRSRGRPGSRRAGDGRRRRPETHRRSGRGRPRRALPGVGGGELRHGRLAARGRRSHGTSCRMSGRLAPTFQM
jgi:NAD(P)-dependent dehydrogenase (short-subunit alcohol dehydrogenase family)